VHAHADLFDAVGALRSSQAIGCINGTVSGSSEEVGPTDWLRASTDQLSRLNQDDKGLGIHTGKQRIDR